MYGDNYERKVFGAFAVTGGLLLILLLFTLQLDEARRSSIVDEGGWVESMSVLGHLLCAALIIYKGKFHYLRRFHYFFLLIIFFLLRELDFDKRFTTMGIFKIKLYLSEAVPFIEKLLGAMVVVLLLYVVSMILWRHLGQFRLGLKHRSPVSVGALIAVVLMFVSKFLDGIGRKLRGFDIAISDTMGATFEATEEILELGLSMVVFKSFLAYFRRADVESRSVQGQA